MVRRHSRGDPGQIPFADLAMATLGPMAALMIIFLILAGINVRPCVSLNVPETEKRAQQIRQWADKIEKTIKVNKNIPTISCENFTRAIIDEIDATPFIPPPLEDLCAHDILNVLGKAGLNQDKKTELITRHQLTTSKAYRDVATNIAKCQEEDSDETFTVTSKKIEFDTCKTSPLHPKTRKEMTSKDFYKDMAEIVDRLNQAPQYNRVDIFGHADARKIKKPCPNGAKNNRELSSLRVHAYLDGLESALKDNKNKSAFKPIYNRWIKGNLKIYAIGVGEKEPIDKRKSKIAYRTNRRIEIRFGIDRR